MGYIQKRYDFLVIGSGLSGLIFALRVAPYGQVAIITKDKLSESNTRYAQGGMAVVADKHDSFVSHIHDTLVAGCYHNNLAAVKVLVNDGPQAVSDLIKLGVKFDKEKSGLALGQEGGHSARRIVHAHDTTGAEIERALIKQIRAQTNIKIFSRCVAADLIVQNSRCVGAQIIDTRKYKIFSLSAKITMLASGGAAGVYARHCNPAVTTGDGIAMAARAGVVMRDLEFIQFHPTVLAGKVGDAMLLSETLRGEGAVLRNAKGAAFMKAIHPMADLAPRDIVCRAIYKEFKNGPVFLDLRHRDKKFLQNRFPYLCHQLKRRGYALDRDLIPVAPAAHYLCGGVHTDLRGQTNLLGLLAAGEVAHTGAQGANRLASNSLLECAVFGERAAQTAIVGIKKFKSNKISASRQLNYRNNLASFKQSTLLIKQARKLMWEDVGVARKVNNLKSAVKNLNQLSKQADKNYIKFPNEATLSARNISLCALLIASAAARRKKSLGCHYLN